MTSLTVREDEPLRRYLPTRAGGPCEAWVVVHDDEGAKELLALCRERGWKRTWLGAGTRVAVRDGGLAGAVVRLGHGFVGPVPPPARGEGVGVWLGAATPLAALGAWLGAHEGFAPLLAAVDGEPGTLGASLAHDAGWAPWVASARAIRRGHVAVDGFDVLAPGAEAWLAACLRPADAPAPQVAARERWWSAPDDDDVAALVRDASLADTRLRDALVPAEAPMMVVNLGAAPARDLALLARSVVERVQTVRGVELTEARTWWGRA